MLITGGMHEIRAESLVAKILDKFGIELGDVMNMTGLFQTIKNHKITKGELLALALRGIAPDALVRPGLGLEG